VAIAWLSTSLGVALKWPWGGFGVALANCYIQWNFDVSACLSSSCTPWSSGLVVLLLHFSSFSQDFGSRFGSCGAKLLRAMNDFFPTLQALVAGEGLQADKLNVALGLDNQRNIRVLDRHSVPVHDGNKIARWQVPALSDLFRGSRPPPPDMDHYPQEYAPRFFFIEKHFLTLCHAVGDRTDQEMEEIYSMLRRRPDGRSLGPAHDFLWQVSALLLGTQVLSAAEFEALIGALERSTRKWALRPISRNYVAYLRQNFG
jgi:hypothetical protein